MAQRGTLPSSEGSQVPLGPPAWAPPRLPPVIKCYGSEKVLKRQISVREKAVAALEDYSFDPHRGTWGMSFGGGLGEKLLALDPKRRNATQASHPGGVQQEDGAGSQAHDLLKKPEIQEALAEVMQANPEQLPLVSEERPSGRPPGPNGEGASRSRR
jgi:hypothetical protein